MLTLPGHVSELNGKLLSKMQNCRKKPIIVQSIKMGEDFRVNSLEGDYAQGHKGGYLMVGIKGELYICAEEYYDESYDTLGPA